MKQVGSIQQLTYLYIAYNTPVHILVNISKLWSMLSLSVHGYSPELVAILLTYFLVSYNSYILLVVSKVHSS